MEEKGASAESDKKNLTVHNISDRRPVKCLLSLVNCLCASVAFGNNQHSDREVTVPPSYCGVKSPDLAQVSP